MKQMLNQQLVISHIYVFICLKIAAGNSHFPESEGSSSWDYIFVVAIATCLLKFHRHQLEMFVSYIFNACTWNEIHSLTDA